MRLPLCLVCAAFIAAVQGDMTAEQETIKYLLPKLTAKFKRNEWRGLSDPRFYFLTDAGQMNDGSSEIYRESYNSPEGKVKRAGMDGGRSLSIVNSLDVLRNKFMSDMAKIKQREGLSRNRDILSQVGKRAALVATRRDFGY